MITGGRPLLVDLFSGAGGCSRGYQEAGFVTYGVDLSPQKHYIGDWFVQADALEFMGQLIAGETMPYGLRLADVAAIHASPPCQNYSRVKGLTNKTYPRLIDPIRELLHLSGKPYIIENVETAPLLNPTMLCGQMFGLALYRHRLFETSFPVPFLWDMPHGRKQDTIHGKQRQRDIVLVVGKAQYKGYRQRASAAMGIDWMLEEELAESIPPAYTRFIGAQLFDYLSGE